MAWQTISGKLHAQTNGVRLLGQLVACQRILMLACFDNNMCQRKGVKFLVNCLSEEGVRLLGNWMLLEGCRAV